MGQVLVARQPIISRYKRTLGYELLFRASESNSTADIVDADAATATVITNTFTEFGFDNIVGDCVAFVNVTAHFLAQPDLIALLPTEQCVLEIMQDIVVTHEVIACVEHLVACGYTLAMDNFDPWGPTAPLLKYATYVKYDYTEMFGTPLVEAIRSDHEANRLVVVQKIETHDQHIAATLAGADYFQGYYFARPTTMTATSVSANAATLMRLLARINQPDATIDDVVDVLTQDVSMSVKALKYVNSAAQGLEKNVESVRHAAVLVGRQALRSWTTLEVMSSLGSKPAELVQMALIRARFCELVARRRGLANPDSFYTVGMLSLLDAMTDTPMDLVVERIAVTDAVAAALLGSDSPFTEVLGLAIGIEQQGGRLDDVLLDDDVIDDHREATSAVNRFLSESALTGV